jgi:hypothetical protein
MRHCHSCTDVLQAMTTLSRLGGRPKNKSCYYYQLKTKIIIKNKETKTRLCLERKLVVCVWGVVMGSREVCGVWSTFMICGTLSRTKINTHLIFFRIELILSLTRFIEKIMYISIFFYIFDLT